jgi:hypothetical protein
MTTNSINLGGVLSGTHFQNSAGNPSVSAQTIGRIGVTL